MKPYVIYFPQYYPIEVNNKSWGYGFTDWHLVSRANLLNEWNRRAPMKGFYIGNDVNVQSETVNEINNYNLGGLALYHYWFFHSHQLNSFENNIIENKLPEIDWFLIWVTESWTKRWIGDDTIILPLTQEPKNEEVNKHCEHLMRCFQTKGYLYIDQRPLFVIYNISHFNYPQKVLEQYKNTFTKLGINPLFGSFIKNKADFLYADLFDINYLFEPRLFFNTKRIVGNKFSEIISKYIKRYSGQKMYNKLLILIDFFTKKGIVYSDKEFIKYFFSNERNELISKLKNFQNVLSPGWNNIPRYGNKKYTCLSALNPIDFKKLVLYSDNINKKYPVLINAWNEWSEGAAIEPCYYEKTKYLDVLVDIKY